MVCTVDPMSPTTKKRIVTGEQAYQVACEKIEALETALHHSRALRAHAIAQMRDEGKTWAEIEEITGLTRQRLNAITRDFA